MKTIFTFLSLIFLIPCFSQEEKKVENIKGSAFISGDVSPNEAKQQALNDAKINALKEAGVEEQINSYQLLFSSQDKNDFSQFFSSDIQSELQGAVKSYTLKSERVYCKTEYEIISEVQIDALIVKYITKPDHTFDANIEGIKGAYNKGENLIFNIKSTLVCFLNIFNITDTDAGMLYPNGFEKSFLLNKLESYKFPIGKVDYTLGNESKKQETNRLIFVLTKRYIPFIHMDKDQICSREEIFSWIYSIPPDQRKVIYFSFSVSK